MSIKQCTNDFKNIQIHVDDKGRLLIDSDLLLQRKKWDVDRSMYHIATLDNIDIEDLFGFCIERLKELGSWETLYHLSLTKSWLDRCREIQDEFKNVA
mgnify:CR=1 FL=1|tara:strand:- start:201 stop:494 length:294 start_codon:yes stop_codon:yes gene_type:complete